ncbi:MAG: MFS transporter [Gemmatimonadaceae bacterium]|nr:MFS transporter [Gemmatimonadaceae bacterium]
MPRSLNPFRALKAHRNFRIFWIGQAVSLTGSWVQIVAQGWLALDLSNDPFIVGVVSAAGSFPVLLFSLYGGVIADRYDKRKLVMIGQSLLALEAAVLWWFVVSGTITIPWLIALAAFAGVVSAFEIPARQALLIELVEREDLMDAIALNTSAFNLARILGPSIAAAVIASAGLAWCFALNTLSFSAVLAGLFMLRLPPHVRPVGRPSPIAGLREGMAYMFATSEIVVVMRMVSVFSIFGVPYLTLMPVFAREALGLGASGYGVLMTVTGVGALSGALFLAAVGGRIQRGRLFATASIAFPLVVLALSATRQAPVAAFVLLLCGLFMILQTALANGILQAVVRDELRGRVMAAYVVVYVGFAPIGSFAGGAMARAVGIEWTLAAGGAVMLLFALWTFWKHPELRTL